MRNPNGTSSRVHHYLPNELEAEFLATVASLYPHPANPARSCYGAISYCLAEALRDWLNKQAKLQGNN